MKKIITAMDNETLNNELRKYAKYDVIWEDLICQDVVLAKLSKIEADVLIISGLLQGRWNLEEFVDKIRKMNRTIRIIVVTDAIDVTTKKILNDHEVLDIFLDSQVEVSDIIDAIDREETIKKKYEMLNDISEEYVTHPEEVISLPIKEEEKIENVIIEKAVQRQEIITISGIPGSGKTTIAANLCRALAQKSECKILLIDLDTLYGNIDELLKINKVPNHIELTIDWDKKSGLNYATELIMKNRLDTNVFGELTVEAEGFDVLTGNTSLHYCQNVLEEKYYQKILQCAKEKYDFIVIDTSSNIFLDSTKWALEQATKVLFVIENNYISLKKMQQILHILVDTWGIFKQKIHLVVNKKCKNEIEADAITKITEGIEVMGEIKWNEENNVASYDKILSSIQYIPKKSIFLRLNELKKNLFMPTKIEKEVAVHAH